MKKRLLSIFIISVLVTCLVGCDINCSGSTGRENSKSKVTTINGMTQGFSEKNTTDKGSAKFNIEDYHVDMTNFSFEADSTGKIEASLNEDNLVFARVTVCSQDGETWQNITDGLYTETFAEDKLVSQFNDIYQKTMLATDSPIVEDIVFTEGTAAFAFLYLNDGEMILGAELGTNKYINIAYTSNEHNTDDIVSAMVQALGGTSINDQNDITEVIKEEENFDEDVKEYEEEEELPDKFSLEVGTIPLKDMKIPKEWVVNYTETIIQCKPEENLYVTYSDSSMPMDGLERMKDEQDSINKIWDVSSDMSDFEYAGIKGYVISWKSNGILSIRIFEPVPNGKTYLKIQIDDYSASGNVAELVEKYSINLDTL